MEVQFGMNFDEYRDMYKEHFEITRKDGIIEVRMAHKGGPGLWDLSKNYGWAPLLNAIRADQENEVLIFGGTGDVFFRDIDREYVKKVMAAFEADPELYGKMMFDTVGRVSEMLRSLVDIGIPTIGVINGPSTGGHYELPLLADLTLCAPNVVFNDYHFVGSMVPGDGTYFVLQQKIGQARTNQYTYLGTPIDAQKAEELGLVTEVHDSDKIYARAWEIAERINERPRAVKRLTHEMGVRQLRKALVDDLFFQCSMEAWAGGLAKSNPMHTVEKKA